MAFINLLHALLMGAMATSISKLKLICHKKLMELAGAPVEMISY